VLLGFVRGLTHSSAKNMRHVRNLGTRCVDYRRSWPPLKCHGGSCTIGERGYRGIEEGCEVPWNDFSSYRGVEGD